MRYLISGLLLLLGMILFFMIITACTPGRSMTIDSAASRKATVAKESAVEEVDFSFDEDDLVDESTHKSFNKPKNKTASTKRSTVGSSNFEDEEETFSDTAKRNERFYQKGEASWYGRAFHGKKTASGERFDMYDYTAAHRTLPFGTILEVKNLENDKTVKVRVNDRGPFKEGRILDVSYAAARKLDMLGSGTAMVGINIIKKGNNEITNRKKVSEIEPAAGDEEYDEDDDHRTIPDDNRIAIQVGAFYSKTNAQRLKSHVQELTHRPVKILPDGNMYKVQIHSISSKKELARIRKTLADENIPSFIIRDVRE